jgi:hypothetical protein
MTCKSHFSKKRRLPWAFLFIGVMLMVFGCGDDHENLTDVSQQPNGFTFLDLNESSTFNKNIRKKLGQQLGSTSVETSITLDLETAYAGFIRAHLPALAQLNRQLNTPLGERVEHHATRLTYRYPERQDYPFEFVSMAYSNFSQKPLVFKIIAHPEAGVNLMDTLIRKYETPRIIDWEKGKSYIWQRADEIMVSSHIPNRLGEKKYHILIYYLKNIRDMINKEAAVQSERSHAKPKDAPSAF